MPSKKVSQRESEWMELVSRAMWRMIAPVLSDSNLIILDTAPEHERSPKHTVKGGKVKGRRDTQIRYPNKNKKDIVEETGQEEEDQADENGEGNNDGDVDMVDAEEETSASTVKSNGSQNGAKSADEKENEDAADKVAVTPAVRKRGRPRKDEQTKTPKVPSGRKRGRPRLSELPQKVSEEANSDEDEEDASTSKTPSRSSKKVRRDGSVSKNTGGLEEEDTEENGVSNGNANGKPADNTAGEESDAAEGSNEEATKTTRRSSRKHAATTSAKKSKAASRGKKALSDEGEVDENTVTDEEEVEEARKKGKGKGEAAAKSKKKASEAAHDEEAEDNAEEEEHDDPKAKTPSKKGRGRKKTTPAKKQAKSTEAAESEEDVNEEEKAEEEAPETVEVTNTGRPQRKVRRKSQPIIDSSTEADEDDVEKSGAGRKRSRSAAPKKKGRKKKDDDDEDDEDEEEEEEEEKGSRKGAKGRKPNKKARQEAEEAAEREALAEERKSRTVPKQAAITGSIPDVSCCAVCSAREFSRAIEEDDKALLKACAEDVKRVPKYTCGARPDDPLSTALAKALLKNDMDAIGIICQAPGTRISPPSDLTQGSSTGYVSRRTYGHALKKVNESRGNREGNNAFFRSTYSPPMEYAKSAYHYDLDTSAAVAAARDPRVKGETLDLLALKSSTFTHIMGSNIFYEALISGNNELAAHLIEKHGSSGGFNHLHEEALKACTCYYTPISPMFALC
ncbi:hypothetical protein HDU67_006707 [Dinochytrium kinnereticum]|nr:hypothetical protein HDU67_006707 [Dinochytrium kinnereticum]